MKDIPIRRGQIWYADLPDEEIGSVQAGRRPVLITQTDRLNRRSPTVVVAVVTSKLKRTEDPVHVVLPKMKGLPLQSMVEAEQKKTISKSQLLDYRCTLADKDMARVTRALHQAEEEDRKSQYKKSIKLKKKRHKKKHKSMKKNKRKRA